MITGLNVASIYVLNQDEALDFYVNKLGLEKGNDVQQGGYRWLTVRVPGDGATEISLEQPGPPLHDDETAGWIRELITRVLWVASSSSPTTRARCTTRSVSAASPTSPRSPPSTSTVPTWAFVTPSATPSGFCSGRGRPAGNRLSADSSQRPLVVPLSGIGYQPRVQLAARRATCSTR